MSSNNHTPASPLIPGLTPNNKIQILLGEYSTLRAEIVSRTANGFTLTTIGVTVLTWVIKELSFSSPWHYWLGVATLLVVFVLGVFVNLRDITRAARRVKTLEHEINSRAGEHLLIWETLSGVATRKGGIIASFFSTVKPLPRYELPPLQDLYLGGTAKCYDNEVYTESNSSSVNSLRDAPHATAKTDLLRSTRSWVVLAIGLLLVGIQGVCAYVDGYFSQDQILSIHNVRNAYAFLEHGGMWADFFITTPIMAYIVGTYRLPYFSWPGLVALVVALLVSILAGLMYQEMGKVFPEAHTHFSYTPLAGWIHGLYAVAAIWIFTMFYLTPVTPRPGNALIVVSVGLTALFILGVMKFNPNWSWSTEAATQVAVSVALLWVITAFGFGRYIERRSKFLIASKEERGA